MTHRSAACSLVAAVLFGFPNWLFAQANIIEGKVLFVGDAAQYPAAFTSGSDSVKCGEKSVRLTKEDVVINPTTPPTLRNVVVSLRAGFGRKAFFKITEEVRLNVRDCQFIPHVLDLNAGQPLRIVNDDAIPHRIRVLASLNDPKEFELAAKEATGEHVLQLKPEAPIQLTCTGYPGQSAFIAVFDNPFHTVTRSDGTYALVGMPDGRYTVEAWHEVFGSQLAIVNVEKNVRGLHDFVFPAPDKPTKTSPAEPAPERKNP